MIIDRLGQRSSSRSHNFPQREAFFFVGICLVAIIWTVGYNRRFLPLVGDAAVYQNETGQITSGHLPSTNDFPFLYPTAAAFLTEVGLSPRVALSSISVVCMLALLLLIYRQGGVVPAAIVAVSPAVMMFGVAAMSEMLFAALFAASVVLFLAQRWFLASVVTLLAFETRYIGVSILLFMLLVVALGVSRTAAQIKAIGLTTLMMGAAIGANFLLYGSAMGSRSPSRVGLIRNVLDLGRSLLSSWAGEGPLHLATGIAAVMLSAVALAALLFILVRSSQRGWSLAVLAYCITLVASESTVAIDQIGRRLMMPIIPLLVLCAFRGSKRYEFAGLALLISLPHLIRGVVS